MTPLRRRMTEDLILRNRTPQTIKAYTGWVADFARYFHTSPDRLGPEHVRSYLLHLVQDQQASWNVYRQARLALRFFYTVTLGREWVVAQVARPTTPKKLPVVLSTDEMARFLDALDNPKHRALLMTAYAGGLRLSEVARLRVEDVDSARMVIHVRQGKGYKDRDVMLSPRLLAVLREYWKLQRPRPFLFPGRKPDRPVSLRTVQMVCQRALEASGLSKHVHMHTLRHYADYRIMPTWPPVTWTFGLFSSPFDSPLAKVMRHNPNTLSFVGIASARNGNTSAQGISSRCISMPTCGRRKKLFPNVTPLDVPPERFRPDGKLLAFLEGL